MYKCIKDVKCEKCKYPEVKVRYKEMDLCEHCFLEELAKDDIITAYHITETSYVDGKYSGEELAKTNDGRLWLTVEELDEIIDITCNRYPEVEYEKLYEYEKEIRCERCGLKEKEIYPLDIKYYEPAKQTLCDYCIDIFNGDSLGYDNLKKHFGEIQAKKMLTLGFKEIPFGFKINKGLPIFLGEADNLENIIKLSNELNSEFKKITPKIKEENSYIVYKHTVPNGKIYIGITSKPVNERWKNGRGYQQNKPFYKDIIKYGWDNIKHEILFQNLTKDEAEKIETQLIIEFDSTNKEKGYNTRKKDIRPEIQNKNGFRKIMTNERTICYQEV